MPASILGLTIRILTNPAHFVLPTPHPSMSKFPSRAPLIRSILVALTLGVTAASAETNRVKFPENLEQLVHYTTVKRGNSTENILTSREAIEAVRNGRPIPNGTHFVLADYRDGAVFRYFVMQKGAGWGADYDARRRTGDWQFQWFNPDRSVNLRENTARCQSCHQGQEDTSYLYTFRQLKEFK